MKVVISAQGTKGDIHPLIGLAKILLNENYDVIFLTNDFFRESLEMEGIPFYSVGTVEQYKKGCCESLWNGKSGIKEYFLSYHFPTFEPCFLFVKNCFEKKVKCVVLTLNENNGARAAAEHFNIPIVQVTLSPNLIFSAISPPAPICWSFSKWTPSFYRKFLLRRRHLKYKNVLIDKGVTATCNNLRLKLGAEKIGKQKHRNEILNIAFFPEWYGMPQKDWPKDIKLVGFPMFDPVKEQAKNEFDSFISKNGTPILFTTGTGVGEVGSLSLECQQICKELGVPGIFVGGHYDLDSNSAFMNVSYVDFEYVLPKCLAIVHHGGMGTTAQAIKAGIPQLVRPLVFDQADNANRIHKLGLGTFVFPEHFKVDNVVPILRDLIRNASGVAALKVYAKDVSRSSGLYNAFKLIQEFIDRLEPNMGRDITNSYIEKGVQ